MPLQFVSRIRTRHLAWHRWSGRLLIVLGFVVGTSALVRVRDHGPGIPAEHAGRIFDRFFSHRPDQAGARQKHAGLGLSIARAIVERHGGALTGATHPGGGAVFELTLPLA